MASTFKSKVIIATKFQIFHVDKSEFPSVFQGICDHSKECTRMSDVAYLKCSLVMEALLPKYVSAITIKVVKTENKAPKPRTTR